MSYAYQNGIYVPAGGLGGLVGNELVPDGFPWPSNSDYVAGLIQGVGAVKDDLAVSFDTGGLVNPPIMQQVAGVRSTLEAATNVAFGELLQLSQDVAALMSVSNPIEVASTVTALVTSGAGIKAISAALEVAGVASESIDMVPMIGQIISAVMEFVVSHADDDINAQLNARHCQLIVEEEQLAFCRRHISEASPVATGAGGPQPSDLFRSAAYYMHGKGRSELPMTLASMYIVLCGGETQGAFPKSVTRAEWQQIVADAKQISGNDRLGIPQWLQRKMWKLCQGIMAGVNDPRPGVPVIGDNGCSLMPILQDICFNLYRVGTGVAPSRGSGFGIDRVLLQRVSQHICGKFRRYRKCSDGEIEARGGDPNEWGEAGQAPYGSASCSMFIDLTASFENSIRGYQNQLEAAGLLDAHRWVWTVQPPKKFHISPSTLKKVQPLIRAAASQSAGQTRAAAAKEKYEATSRSAAIATSAIIAAAGAAFIGRRLGKKRRARR